MHHDRQEREDPEKTDGQSSYRADSEGIPEWLGIRTVYEEWNHTENGGKDGQEDRDNLVIECTDECLYPINSLDIVMADDVNAGIDGQAGEQYHSRKATGAERNAREMIGQKESDE